MSDCFGNFWEEDEPQCKGQCQKYAECLEKFAMETLPQLQGENPGMQIGEDFENMSGVTVASLKTAVKYREDRLANKKSDVSEKVEKAEDPVAEVLPESEKAIDVSQDSIKEDDVIRHPGQMDIEDVIKESEKPKKRGRPPKKKSEEGEEKPKRKRGRPPKKKSEGEEKPKKRGRPPKKKPEVQNPPSARAAKAATVRAKQKKAASVKPVMVEGSSPCQKQKQKFWTWNPKHNRVRNQREKQRNSYITRLKPGMKLKRLWKGKVHEVIVLKRSYRYRGREYPTLQSITTEIVGTKPYPKQRRPDGTIPLGVRYLCPWSATRFFRLLWIMGPSQEKRKTRKKKSRKN